ncbi:staygreen family protein [Halobacillus salinus]|uniref:Staygreen protein domain-containing protein n=1 Tax=Halobacillus salinus TaxID=192814 RepID=A0A4Z0GYZ0_9BACI|nr:staygreen family protein [Halobacillus salinus]TGB03432.1 hypothetical protein E4663_00040 [Halobacillus salinus]
MKRLQPEKLFVEWRNGVGWNAPVEGRKYTLTHSDETGELFLTIGTTYAFDKITPMRDEVLAEWRLLGGCPVLYVFVDVDGESAGLAAVRNAVFVRELPLALEAMRYGDRCLFLWEPCFDVAPVLVRFHSADPRFNRLECWGVVGDYR